MQAKEKGVSPQAAPQNHNTRDYTESIPKDSYLLGSRIMECYVCQGDADPEHDDCTVVEVTQFGAGFGIAVVVCPACTARAIEQDGSIEPLVADIRANYPKHATLASPARPSGPPPVELAPRPLRTAGLRHPAFGAVLLADPPPADESLLVLLGWEHARSLPVQKLVVEPTQNPRKLRFDVAKDRRVRVLHPHDANHKTLLALAQQLIDFGAREVELLTHPGRPGSKDMEFARIVPKGGA